MSDKIKCPGCKKSIKKTARFCGYCGAKVEAENTFETTPVSSPDIVLPESEYEEVTAVLPALDDVEHSETTAETLPAAKEDIPVETEGMLCTACGAKMRAGAKFCGVCGSNSLVSVTASAERIQEETIPEVLTHAAEEETFVTEDIEKTRVISLPPEAVIEESHSMICTYCGAKMHAGAKFCGVCGGDSLMDERMLEEEHAISPAPVSAPIPAVPTGKGFRPANVDDLRI